MNYNITNHNSIIPKAYNFNVLEGNWYEERCTSEYDKSKKKNFLLKNASDWQYEKTYDNIGSNYKNLKNDTIAMKFSNSNDNYINFQNEDNKMYISTYRYYKVINFRHSFEERYRESFRKPVKNRDYFKNKGDELSECRKTWTKREQNFDTTYKNDILKVTGKSLINKYFK